MTTYFDNERKINEGEDITSAYFEIEDKLIWESYYKINFKEQKQSRS